MTDTVTTKNKAGKAAFILKIVKIVAIVLLSVIIALSALTIVLSKLGLRRTSRWFPGAFVTIESGSMEPLLHTGDLIFVWGTSYEELQVGDVITVYTGEEFVTHGISRIEDEAVITKGLSNEEEDLPIDEREYVAKMVFCVPGGAFAWEWISSPGFIVLAIVLLALLIFSAPLCRLLYRLVQKTAVKKQIRVGALRIVGFIACVSLLFTAPYFSSAKYKAQIDDQLPAKTNTVYFTSNYLTSGTGSQSQIQGWNGITYEFHLKLKNYDNELLYNATGTDLKYQFTIDNVSVSTPTILDKFEFVVKEGETTLDNELTSDLSTGFYGTYTPSEIAGGSLQTSELFVTLQSTEYIDNQQVALAPTSWISFTFTALVVGEGYSQSLSAEYKIIVADDTIFISNLAVTQKTGSSVFNVSMKSNQVAGISSRRIRFIWDPAVMYLNEYDATAMYLKKTGVYNKEEGWLEANVMPLSTITLQFFKRETNIDISVGATYVPSDGTTSSYDVITITSTDLK